jgi:hypothetical protein
MILGINSDYFPQQQVLYSGDTVFPCDVGKEFLNIYKKFIH